uniref:Uncharacterized protein n=1 Tax=Triticum urartu TaxID=4572 RepID=A0A8R7VJG0_TRIUA
MHTFRRFEDKSDAINLTTRRVGPRMISLICKYCLLGELIIVGSLEYKSILEENLRRACSYNDIVREIMWGMQNLMPLLIPQEQSVFTKADPLPICKGLDMLLSRHGIDNVKQEWINEDILQLALKVYHVDLRENEHSKFLRRSLGLDKHLKAISGFDAKDWDLVKLATALKTMVDPNANILPLDKAFEMFSHEEAKLIKLDAPKYEDLLDRDTISEIYDDIVAFREYVDKVLLKLRHLLKKAEAALETEDVMEKAATNGVDSMQQVDHTCLAVDLEVPNQQCHITDGAEISPPSKTCRRNDAGK